MAAAKKSAVEKPVEETVVATDEVEAHIVAALEGLDEAQAPNGPTVQALTLALHHHRRALADAAAAVEAS